MVFDLFSVALNVCGATSVTPLLPQQARSVLKLNGTMVKVHKQMLCVYHRCDGVAANHCSVSEKNEAAQSERT